MARRSPQHIRKTQNTGRRAPHWLRLLGARVATVGMLAAALQVVVVPVAAVAAPYATVGATITVGSQPWGIAFHPDGTKAFVGNSGSNTVSVIAVAERTVTTLWGNLLLGPAGVAVTPNGSRVLVTAYLGNDVVAVDTADGSQFAIGEPVCGNPLPIVMRPDGAVAYFGCWDGRVRSIDPDSLVMTEIDTGWDGLEDGQIDDVAYVPQGTKASDAVAFVKNRTKDNPVGTFRLSTSPTFVTLPGWSLGFAVDTTGTYAYVGDVTGTISVFDLTQFPSVPIHTITVGGSLTGMTLSPNGDTLYVLDDTANKVKMLDVATRTVIGEVLVGLFPRHIAISPDGATALVTNNAAGTVTMLDLFGGSCLAGEGTALSPFLVATVADLAKVGRGDGGCTLTAHYRQTANIVMPAVVAPQVRNFTPIALVESFTGVYDGMNYTLDGLVLNDTQTARTSIFGQLGSGAIVRDMVIANPVVYGNGFVGVIAGFTGNGVTVTGITVTNATVSGNDTDVGGIVGLAFGASAFTNLTFSGVVSGVKDYTGGVIGYAGNGTQMLNVSFTGSVSSVGEYVGGVVGYANNASFGQLTVGPATILGEEMVGGVVGYALNSSFQDLNVTASVVGVDRVAPQYSSIVGGVVGYANTATFSSTTAIVSVLGETAFAGGFAGYANTSQIETAHVSGSVTGRTNYVGGITGYTTTSTLRDVQFSGSVVATGHYAGGATGYLGSGSTLTRITTDGAVTGFRYIGGIAGYANSNITSVVSHMSVVGLENMTGGVAGYLSSGRAITGSYSTGPVSGVENVGGLVGINVGAIVSSYSRSSVSGVNIVGGLVGAQVGSGSLVQSYATGVVSGNTAGGLVGFVDGFDPVGSFWDRDTSGRATSAGGTGKTTDQMKHAATYLTVTLELPTAWTLTDGWQPAQDAADRGICATVNDGYPFFLREHTTNPCPVAPVAVELPIRTLTCDWGEMVADTPVVCTLTGGVFGQAVTWNSSFNPTFAFGTVTLGADGSGSFTFGLPIAAAGYEVMVNVDGWGVFGSGQMVALAEDAGENVTADGAASEVPVPTGVPAGGGGPLPLWPVGVLGAMLYLACSPRFKRLSGLGASR